MISSIARAFVTISRLMSTPIPAGWAHLPPRGKAVETAARAEVEHGLSRLERRDRLGVAASEPHVGTLGNRGQVGWRVAESEAGVGLGAAATDPATRRLRRGGDPRVLLTYRGPSRVTMRIAHVDAASCS